MQEGTSHYRELLKSHIQLFSDRVNDPWATGVPDLSSFNGLPFEIIRGLLNEVSSRDATSADRPSQGVLVLGEAGCGKTHLLMRLARELSQHNHVMFIRKLNNEDRVAVDIWDRMIESLTRTTPGLREGFTQLDDLLANVFRKIIEHDFHGEASSKAAQQRKSRWLDPLREDPYNLFRLLGEGKQRQLDMDYLRRRLMSYLQEHHPEADPAICRALMTYCLVKSDDHKRNTLLWLRGRAMDEAAAKTLGLEDSWLTTDDTYSQQGYRQHRDELALRAIRTLGTLSIYYEPLILAFDQLEGLKREPVLTRRWGDAMREIFTMTPNLVVISCVFPDDWKNWFNNADASGLDTSAAERIGQYPLELDAFEPIHAHEMMSVHLRPLVEKYQLPNDIYPFDEDDLLQLSEEARSPRQFLQNARKRFHRWLFTKPDAVPPPVKADTGQTSQSSHPDVSVAQPGQAAPAESDSGNPLLQAITDRMTLYRKKYARLYTREIDGDEQETQFGTIISFLKAYLNWMECPANFTEVANVRGIKPPHRIISFNGRADAPKICLVTCNIVGEPFSTRMKTLVRGSRSVEPPARIVLVRDMRSPQPKPRQLELLAELNESQGSYLHAGVDELSLLDALATLQQDVRSKDLFTDDGDPISEPMLFQCIYEHGVLWESQLYCALADQADWFAPMLGPSPGESVVTLGKASSSDPQTVAKDGGSLGNAFDRRLVSAALSSALQTIDLQSNVDGLDTSVLLHRVSTINVNGAANPNSTLASAIADALGEGLRILLAATTAQDLAETFVSVRKQAKRLNHEIKTALIGDLSAIARGEFREEQFITDFLKTKRYGSLWNQRLRTANLIAGVPNDFLKEGAFKFGAFDLVFIRDDSAEQTQYLGGLAAFAALGVAVFCSRRRETEASCVDESASGHALNRG